MEIFSIKRDVAILQAGNENVYDVRFTARISQNDYLSPDVLHGLIAQHKRRFEEELDAEILAIGIDLCKFTRCDNGCETLTDVKFDGIVVHANNTVIVGLNAQARDECVCPIFKPKNKCDPTVCYNGGVCHNTYPGTL